MSKRERERAHERKRTLRQGNEIREGTKVLVRLRRSWESKSKVRLFASSGFPCYNWLERPQQRYASGENSYKSKSLEANHCRSSPQLKNFLKGSIGESMPTQWTPPRCNVLSGSTGSGNTWWSFKFHVLEDFDKWKRVLGAPSQASVDLAAWLVLLCLCKPFPTPWSKTNEH